MAAGAGGGWSQLPTSALAWLDQLHRRQGESLARIGYGAQETLWRPILERPIFTLRAYGGSGAPGAHVSGSMAPVLIVPAPIKRPYIWDLVPQRSVVRRLLAAGFAVHLIEWRADAPATAGLEAFAATAIGEAVAALGGRVLLAGHSLGGTLATLHAAFAPAGVAALLLIESPLAFGAATGGLAALLAYDPEGGQLDQGLPDRVPGSLLALASAFALPQAFILDRWRDARASLGDPEALDIHLRVLRWGRDEFAMPRALFTEVVSRLYRGDDFAGGRLRLGGIAVRPETLTMPVAAVVDPSSRLVPPDSALAPLRDRPDLTVYDQAAETGVALQHVGALVGARAHADLWPQLTGWLARHGRASGPPGDSIQPNVKPI